MRLSMLPFCLGFLWTGACSTSAPGGVVTSEPTPASVVVRHGGGNQQLEMVGERNAVVDVVMAADERVFTLLTAAYAAQELQAGRVQGQAQTFGTRTLRLSGRLGSEPLSRFLSCGNTPAGAPAANGYLAEVTVRSQVSPVDATMTRIVTRVEGVAVPRGGNDRVVCTSTGALERRIHEELHTLARG